LCKRRTRPHGVAGTLDPHCPHARETTRAGGFLVDRVDAGHVTFQNHVPRYCTGALLGPAVMPPVLHLLLFGIKLFELARNGLCDSGVIAPGNWRGRAERLRVPNTEPIVGIAD
jgi:hypothetical protein